ncbi:glycosyltransferase [Raoultella lignicola]|uniref:Glycosyltransferase n=1 Tax=Raoultella lignicola TaxID=3040939 RepID=A0ABU9FCS6_9ENTR
MFLTAACAYSNNEDCKLIINKNNFQGMEFAKENGGFSEIILIDDFNEKFSSLFVWFRWKQIYKITKIIKGSKEIFCVSQGRIESGNIGILAAKITGLKVVSYIPMVHSHQEMGGSGVLNKVKDLLCGLLYALPDVFITISPAVFSALTKLSNAKVFVVENFVQQKIIEDGFNPPERINDDCYKLVIPGRLLNKQKGQLDFIQAFQEIKNKSKKDIICYIVGDGPDREIIENEIVKYNLSSSIYVLGNRNDLLNIISCCDLVVLPSRFEGVPLVLLEAAQLNKKIVASDIVGFNDYLSSQYLFTASDKTSLIKCITANIKNDSELVTYKQELVDLLKRNEAIYKDEFLDVIEVIKKEYIV